MEIAVIGSGYVGLVAATCLAELGHEVLCVDNKLERVEALNEGKTLIHEEYLAELLARTRGSRLSFTTDSNYAIRKSTAIVIAVGTPQSSNGHADLSYVEAVAVEIARAATGYRLVIEKSTVPVCTNASIRKLMLENGCHEGSFDVVSNPEFLREGTAIRDFLYPDRIVVGAATHRAKRLMREIYSSLLDGSYASQPGAVPPPDDFNKPFYLETSPQSAELIKHASNSFLAMKISFINLVATIAEATGADIEEVRLGIGSDSRIGHRFLRAGIGYGGSCFPKDVAAFEAVAATCGAEWELLDAIRRINERQLARFLEKARDRIEEWECRNLSVLGLAFKGGTDDIRESPAIQVVQALLDEGYSVTAFDPAAMAHAAQVLQGNISYAADAYLAAENADALLILTEWDEFANLDLSRLKQVMNQPVILDGRNLFSPETMSSADFAYYSVGRAAVAIAAEEGPKQAEQPENG